MSLSKQSVWEWDVALKTEVSSRPEPTRISCHVALDRTTYAPFCNGKAHEVYQRHQAQQEIWGSEVEGPAVHHPQHRI
jgi:hypothetical protein